MVGQKRLGLEAEAAEHRDQRSLVGDHLDDELVQAHLDRVEHRPLGQPAPDAAAAVVGVDDQPNLADVARPADEPRDLDRADDLTVLNRDSSSGTRSHPILDYARVADVLLEERPVTFRNALEEARQRRAIPGLG